MMLTVWNISLINLDVSPSAVLPVAASYQFAPGKSLVPLTTTKISASSYILFTPTQKHS